MTDIPNNRMTPDQIRQALINRPTSDDLDSKIGWIVSPEDFGARQDGVTDDRNAHQAAQNAAQTNQTILITGPSALSAGIAESGKFVLRESTGPIAWPTAADAQRAMPGLADGSLANSYAKIMNYQDGSGGSAGIMFISFRAKPSSHPSSFEKDALIVIARSEDASTGAGNGGTGTDVNHDVVGIGGRAYVHAGNMAGRVWGMNAYALVSAGSQGRACGIEVDVDNEINDVVTDMNGAFLKQGVHIVSKSGLVGIGSQINAGGATGFARGYVVRAGAINATHGISAYEYEGLWRVNRLGDMFVNKPNGAEDETGIALMQANGLAVFSRNAAEGTTRFVRGGTLAGAANLWSQDALAYSTAGTQRVFSRMQTAAIVATDGAETGEIRISTMQGGTLTQQMRIGNTGGIAIGPGAIGPGGPGRMNLSDQIQINGTRVINARKTGWSVPTGARSRATFDTATVTVSQLAQVVAALFDDLHANSGHGLIGA